MNNIKAARRALRLTQQEVADYLNVNRVTYARYESSEIEPSIATLIALAKFFDTTVDYLVACSEQNAPVAAHADTQALTEEEQELLKLWRSADQTSHMYAISVLKTKNSIYEERGIS